MTDRDPQLAPLLERLVPPVTDVRERWNSIVTAADAGGAKSRQAGQPRRRIRLVIALCVIAVGVLVPVIAFATGGWWFQHPSGVTNPVEPVNGAAPSIIASGSYQGERWTAITYLSKQPGQIRVGSRYRPLGGRFVCVSFIVGSLSNRPNGTACGFLRGMPMPRLGSRGPGAWLTFLHINDPPVIAGAVAKGVARVEIVLLSANGTTPAGTVDVPLEHVQGIGHGVRAFALPYPAAGIDSISAFDASGKLLERI